MQAREYTNPCKYMRSTRTLRQDSIAGSAGPYATCRGPLNLGVFPPRTTSRWRSCARVHEACAHTQHMRAKRHEPIAMAMRSPTLTSPWMPIPVPLYVTPPAHPRPTPPHPIPSHKTQTHPPRNRRHPTDCACDDPRPSRIRSTRHCAPLRPHLTNQDNPFLWCFFPKLQEAPERAAAQSTKSRRLRINTRDQPQLPHSTILAVTRCGHTYLSPTPPRPPTHPQLSLPRHPPTLPRPQHHPTVASADTSNAEYLVARVAGRRGGAKHLKCPGGCRRLHVRPTDSQAHAPGSTGVVEARA